MTLTASLISLTSPVVTRNESLTSIFFKIFNDCLKICRFLLYILNVHIKQPKYLNFCLLTDTCIV